MNTDKVKRLTVIAGDEKADFKVKGRSGIKAESRSKAKANARSFASLWMTVVGCGW